MAPLAYRHAKVQRVRRLLSRRTTRAEERAFVAEGSKVVGEALAAGIVPESVYLDPASAGPAEHELAAAAHDSGARVFELAAGVLERVAGTVTPQPLLAVVPMVDVPLAELADGTLVLVCADVRDPGNLGTILRTGAAAGAGGVVCCAGGVDPYNPKCVRASAGTVFHVPLVVGGDAVGVLSELGARGWRRLGTVVEGGVAYTATDLRGAVALALGNEAHGLPGGLAGALDGEVTIPLAGPAESLNVGMAAAVVAFEALRQRRCA